MGRPTSAAQFCGVVWPGVDLNPDASKTNVLTSDSAPCAGTSCPLKRKLTPAALPILTVIWREARTDVFAGAISVSCVTNCPSARTEIQEFSEARMTSVKVVDCLSEDLETDLSNRRTVTSLDSVVSAAGAEEGSVEAREVEGGGGEDTAACAGGDTLFDGAGAGLVVACAGAGSGDDEADAG